MKRKILVIALGSILTASLHAAALDRTGQSVAAFLQPNNYFEAGLNVSDASVEGKEAGTNPTQNHISDITPHDIRPYAALKLQLTPQFSFGFLYDQPFGSQAEYSGDNSFVAKDADRILLPGLSTENVAKKTGETAPTGVYHSKIETQSYSFILGYQPNKNWNVYAGPVYQTAKADIHLRGEVYSLFNGYDFVTKEVGDWGYLAGFAYQIPQKGLKASLTYRSEISHDVDAQESLPIIDMLSMQQGRDAVSAHLNHLVSVGAVTPEKQAALNHVVGQLPNAGKQGVTNLTSPQSVNLDFQTALSKTTLLFANLRWVNWDGFNLQPYQYHEVSKIVGKLSTPSRPDGFNLVQYDKDQWSASIGVGQRFNAQWTGSAMLGWDSGAGDKVSPGGPTNGYYSLGVGGQYSPTPKYFISGGVKYFWLGDAKAQLGSQAQSDYYVGDFSDNHAVGYGLKIGYRF